jgi:hypothetical protein
VVKSDGFTALLNRAEADKWELQQVIPRESSNKFQAVFRKERERSKQQEGAHRAKGNWIGDWGFN